MNITTIGDIEITYHPRRALNSLRVAYEDATLTRTITVTDDETSERTLIVNVYGRTGDIVSDDCARYEVNWFAIGSQPSEIAAAYAALLLRAAEVADALTAAYVKP